MDFWEDTLWFAVQTKPHQENLAARSLAQLGLEVFLPRIQRDQSVGGVMRRVVQPLFAGYLFARFCPLAAYEAAKSAHGVLRVVGTHRTLLPISSEIMAGLRERVQVDGFVRLERRSFKPGEKVTIDRGPLAGWIGRVEREWDDGRRVTILLEALLHSQVIVERRCLSPLDQAA